MNFLWFFDKFIVFIKKTQNFFVKYKNFFDIL